MYEKDADRKELTRTRKTKRRRVSRLTVGSGSAFGLDCNPRFARRILTTFLALVVAFASIPLPAIAEVADEAKATIAEKTVASNDDALAEVEESSLEPNVNSDNASLTKDSVGGAEDPAIEGDASKELKQAEPYDEPEEVADHAWDKTEEGVLSSTLSAQAGTDCSFDDTSEAYRSVIEEWRLRIERDKTSANGIDYVGDWYYSVSPKHVSTNNSKTGDAFVYCYQKFDGFDVPMLIVADPDDNYKVYGCYQYLTDNGNIAIYTSHFRYCKWLCNEGCFKSWSNGPAASTYYRFYWSERPAGFSELSAGQFYLTFTDVNRFEYGADSKPGMFTDASGAQTSMSINDGRARIDSLHSLATGITWHKIVEEFVEPPTQKVDISQANVSIIPKQDWTGSAIEPKPIVSMGNKTLNEGTDYTLSYENNVGPGTATIIIAGIGDYSGNITRDFDIEKCPSSGNTYAYSISDTYCFENYGTDVHRAFYERLYGRSHAHVFMGDDEVQHLGGVCFGMSTSALMMAYKKWPSPHSFGSNGHRAGTVREISNPNWYSNDLNLTLDQFIKLAHIFQYDKVLEQEWERNKNNMNGLVEVVKQSLGNPDDREPVVVGLHDHGWNHTVWPIGVGTDNSYRTEILVYDPNCEKDDADCRITLSRDSAGNYISWNYTWGTDGHHGSTYSNDPDGTEIGWQTPSSRLCDLIKRSSAGNIERVEDFDTLFSIEERKGSSILLEDMHGNVKYLSEWLEELPHPNLLIKIEGWDVASDDGKASGDDRDEYWIDSDHVTLSNIPNNTSFRMGDYDSGASVHVDGASSASLDFSTQFTTVSLEGAGSVDRFEVEHFADVDDELKTVTLSGNSAGEVVSEQTEDGVEISGASELVARNSDNRTTRAIELDANKTYTVLPGDENTDPEIVSEASDPVPVFDQKAIAVAAGGAHSAAILEDGSLWTWGCNDNGQLGDGTYEGRLSPVKIMEGVTSVALGSEHSAAIKSDGSLWMWGRNRYGSLGDGTTVTRTTPVKVMEGVAQVSCGNGTTAALKTDGTLWVWGFAGLDGLGIGEPASIADYRSIPVQLASNVASVSMGYNLGAYVTADGKLFAWGAGAMDGSVGTGSKENVFVPTKILEGVLSVDMGRTSAAVKADGSLWMWGTWRGNVPEKVLYEAASVSVGSGFVAVCKLDGSLNTLGSNIYGQLGDSSIVESRSTFAKVSDAMANVDVGDQHCVALDTDGVVYTWGSNGNGQLGTGSTDSTSIVKAMATGSPSPVTMAGLVDISTADVTGVEDVDYEGSIARQTPVVTLGGKTLEEGWDYEVSYEGNDVVGDAQVVVKGKGIYAGEVKVGFKVRSRDISDASIAPIADVTYTDSPIMPKVIVTLGSVTLREGVDFDASYKNNLDPGIATVTITGKGNYKGTKSAEFKIRATNRWVRQGGSWYYYGADGGRAKGWKQVGGKWYYLDPSTGAMRTGWLKSGSAWYYLTSSGAMAVGWAKVGSAWYYFAASGAMKTGWIKLGSAWYYLKGSGAMATGWAKLGSTWYYFNASGAMKTGWQKLGSTWYYFNSSGAMLTGRQSIGGKWYTFSSSGAWVA